MNGGKGGMIYTYLGGLVGFSFVILSMAEMASMYSFPMILIPRCTANGLIGLQRPAANITGYLNLRLPVASAY
jgi:hypothetical protein